MTSKDVSTELSTGSAKQTSENLTIKGSTFTRYGHHIVVGERRPLDPNANLNPASLAEEREGD